MDAGAGGDAWSRKDTEHFIETINQGYKSDTSPMEASDGDSTRENAMGRRRYNTLPVCPICKVFWPKNRSDQMYPLQLHRRFLLKQ